jgi:hypothetical protein
MCYITDFNRCTTPILRKKSDCLSCKAAPIKKVQTVKKSVRFSRFNVVQIRARSTREDRVQAWNQPEDIEKIKIGVRQSINAVHAVGGNLEKLDNAEYCHRGLEAGISKDILRLKRSWIKNTAQNVMEEQRVQRSLGIYDPERLSDISANSSRQARQTAAHLGLLDAKACW